MPAQSTVKKQSTVLKNRGNKRKLSKDKPISSNPSVPSPVSNPPTLDPSEPTLPDLHTIKPFHLGEYITQINDSFEDASTILARNNAFLKSYSKKENELWQQTARRSHLTSGSKSAVRNKTLGNVQNVNSLAVSPPTPASDQENDSQNSDDGWHTVSRRKLSRKALSRKALVSETPKSLREKKGDMENTTKSSPPRLGVDKLIKDNFYAFQVTNRWKEKASRIASRLQLRRDVFGRPIGVLPSDRKPSLLSREGRGQASFRNNLRAQHKLRQDTFRAEREKRNFQKKV